MEFKCDRCGQQLVVPDKWAGRRVRCRGCNRVLVVPDEDAGTLGSSINLGALAASTEEPSEEEVVTDFAPIPVVSRKDDSNAAKRFARKCPHCGKTVQAQDLYSEVLCSGCWKPVPPSEEQLDLEAMMAARASREFERVTGFYDELVGAIAYPIDSLGNILLGMLVAGGAILLPVAMILMFVMGVALNPIADEADTSWLSFVLAGMFMAEGIYFAGMAYTLLLEAARQTIAHNDKPPDLTWNLASVGAGIVSYVTLVVVYGLVFFGVNYVTSGGNVVLPTTRDEVRQLLSPLSMVVLAVLTFSVPMAIVGLASMPGLGGLSPGRIVRSIGGCFIHYLFLFVVTCVLLAVFLGITSAIVGWASEAVMKVVKKGISDGFDILLLGLLAWAVLIGTGFYCALMLGRIHGLFARTFRAHLAFDL